MIITFHIIISILNYCILHALCHLNLFFREDVYHICNKLSIQISDQFQIGILTLNQIFHLEIFIFCQIRVMRPNFFRDKFTIYFLFLIQKSAFYHILHLQFNSLDYSKNLLLDISLFLLTLLFCYINTKLLFFHIDSKFSQTYLILSQNPLRTILLFELLPFITSIKTRSSMFTSS